MSPYIFEFLFQLLKYLLIFSGLYILLRYFLDRRASGVKPVQDGSANMSLVTLRLQAYERFILYLERNNPSSLVTRMNSPGLTSLQLQSLVVKTIREEFDYNLSQQLYISVSLWELIKNAKEESIALINQAMSELAHNAPAEELVHLVLTLMMQNQFTAVNAAISSLKNEADQLLKSGF